MRVKPFGVIALLAIVFSVSVSAHISCEDSDGGIDPWVGGIVETNVVIKVDECFGNVLQEKFCEGTEPRTTSINCETTFNAVCIEDIGPDYCDCPQGTVYDDNSDSCIPVTEVPEFSGFAAGLALTGSIAGFLILKRRK